MAQKIICDGCGTILFASCKIKSPYDIIQALNRECPQCGKDLEFNIDKITIEIAELANKQ